MNLCSSICIYGVAKMWKQCENISPSFQITDLSFWLLKPPGLSKSPQLKDVSIAVAYIAFRILKVIWFENVYQCNL